MALGACAGGSGEEATGPPDLTAVVPAPAKVALTSPRSRRAARPAVAAAERPRIVTPAAPLQCVPFAREASTIGIRGNAWTWWRQAEGRYDRKRLPAVGSVLVLKARGGSRGHVAVVKQIRSDREIVVDHANWLNRGRIHLGTPVKDVSTGNDWSAVRVWYIPGDGYGAGVYPAQGFIYPSVTTAAR